MKGFILVSERLIQALQQVRTETGGQRRARFAEKVSDALQAHHGQVGDHAVIKTQGGQRQRCKECPHGLAGDETLVCCIASGCPCGAYRWRDGKTRREPESFKTFLQIIEKSSFAAQQMSATGDIDG